MAKPKKGADTYKNTAKTAAQLRKEEEERKRAEAEAQKTASVPVAVSNPSTFMQQTKASSDSQNRWNQQGQLDKVPVTQKDRFKEQQIESRTYSPVGKLPAKKTISQRDAAISAETAKAEQRPQAKKQPQIPSPKYDMQYENAGIAALERAKKDTLLGGTPLKAVINVPGMGRLSIDDLKRQGYDDAAIARVQELVKQKQEEARRAKEKQFTATYVTPDQAQHIVQHFSQAQKDTLDKLEQKISLNDFESEQQARQYGVYYRALNDRRMAELMADADVDTINKEIEAVEAKLQQARNAPQKTVAVTNSTDANDKVVPNNAVAFYENKLNTLQQIADYKEAQRVIGLIDSKNAKNDFDELFTLYNERSVINERINKAQANSRDADERWTQRASAERLVQLSDVEKRIKNKEAELKSLGFTNNAFQIYSDLKNKALKQKIDVASNNLVALFPLVGSFVNLNMSEKTATALAGAAGLVLSGATAPVRGYASLMDLGNTQGVGYQAGHLIGDTVSSVTSAVVQNIEKNHPVIGKPLGKLYQIAESTVDSVVNNAVMGSFSAPIMGLNACAQEYDDALARGIPAKQSAALGVLAGVFETAFEFLSLEKIHAIADVKHLGVKGLAEAFAKTGFFEGTEEINTSIANYIADYLLAGGLSKYNTAMANGYTPSQHAQEVGKEIFEDFLGGAISGMAIGGTSGLANQGIGMMRDYAGNISAGAKIANTGDVTEVINAAKNSESKRTQNLGAKLEGKVQNGKSAPYLTGRVYNRVQGENIAAAAAEAYRNEAAASGEQVDEKTAKAVGAAVDEFRRTYNPKNGSYILEPAAQEAVQDGIGKKVFDDFTRIDRSSSYADEAAKKYDDFARSTGAYDDAEGRRQIHDRSVAARAADVTKAVRGENSYTLVENGSEGRMGGDEGASVNLGGMTELDDQGRMMLVTDYQKGSDVQATAPFSTGGEAGTVHSNDAEYDALLTDVQEHLNGRETGGFGTAYQSRNPVTMSTAAANTAIAQYSPRVNPDAKAYSAWFWDAYKAGKRGMSLKMYLSLYNQRGAGQWTEHITEAQLREAFRVGAMEFDPGNGVTRIGTMQLTKRMQGYLDVLDYVAKKLGFSIIATDDIAGKNGYISSRADVVVVSLSAEGGVIDRFGNIVKEGRIMTAAFHEIYHAIRRELGEPAAKQLISLTISEYKRAVGEERFNDDFADIKARYKKDIKGLSEEETEWFIKEELAAQYFGNLAEENIQHIVKQLDTGDGHKILQKISELLEKFKEAIREAFARLAGEDPASYAAIRTEVENAERVIDMFIETARQTEGVREERLARQGEVIRKQAEDVNFGQIENAETQGMTASLRTEPAPKKTQQVYKLMHLGEDGRLYPLFIDSAEGIDLKKWYNADSPGLDMMREMPSGVFLIDDANGTYTSLEEYNRDNGVKKSGKNPSKDAINKAANEGKRWVLIESTNRAQSRYGGELRKYYNFGINGSGSVSTFAMRPGWHAGSLPTMRQIGKGSNKDIRDDSFVWVRGFVPADVDYQAEADNNPDHDIPDRIPVNGFYMKATNADKVKSQADKVGWYVAGAFYADEIIGDMKARSVIDEWNAAHPGDNVEYDYGRENGRIFDAKRMQLVGGGEELTLSRKSDVANGFNFDYNEYETHSGEKLRLTDPSLYPQSNREWSSFARSFANKTNGMKPGETRHFDIYTADYRYIMFADGYMQGSILNKISLNDNDDAEEFVNAIYETSDKAYVSDETFANRQGNRNGSTPLSERDTDPFYDELDQFIESHPQFYGSTRKNGRSGIGRSEESNNEERLIKQETGEVDIDGNPTSHTYSKKSLAVGLGYDLKEVDGIYQIVDRNGVPVEEITEDVVRRSPLGNMVGIAVARGNITRAEAAQQYEMLTQLLQMTADYKDFTLPWEVSGSLLFSAIKANSDAQYGRTIDFSTICKKTQTIINVMSKTMMDLNRGLTAKEVREIVYEEVGKAGEPTPCPVCYVFSRWMGIGGILQNIYDFQNKYNDATKEDVLRLCEETEAKIRAFADAKKKDAYFDKDGNYKYGKIVSEMKSKPDGRVKRAQAKIDAHYEALETIEYTQQQLKKSGLDQKTINAYNEILKAAKKKVLTDRTFKNAQKTIEDGRRELAPLEEYQFIKSTRFNSDGTYDELYTPVRGENGKTAQQALADVLFDLNNAEGLATEYPSLWRYRSTRGCNAGKAILPYSDMWTGEIVQGIAGDIKDIQRGDANSFLNGDAERQQELLDSAQRKQAAQNIIGGMRFQSTSDFRYEYGSDYLMAFLELQSIGANVQLYTKVIEAVDFFASMGADCNLSLMPENDGFRVDENGNRVLAFSSVTGINADGAFKLIDKYDNVQAILVGISDEHIATAIGDRRIGFVIPFHGSGNTVKVIADLMSLLKQNLDITTAKDYSTVQNDRERSEKSYHGDAALYERHKRLRQLRMMILTGRDGGKNAEFTDTDKQLIGENPYLTDLYYRFWVDKSNKGEYGVRLTKSQAEKIFPFEYWDKSATLDNADVNGNRFIEYCDSLGYYPRFSGVVDANGKKGAYGDFTGNTGYWKLLIDRPMYDLNGKYRDQQKINATSMQTNFLSPAWATQQYGEYMQKDSTKDMELVADIAQRVEDRIAGEEDEEITASKKTQTVEEKYDEAVAENAELKDQLRETKRLLKAAQKKLDKATFDAWIAGQETGGRVPVRNQVLDVVKQYNDPKLSGVSDEALTKRIVDSLLEMDENDYAVDVLVNDLWGTMFDQASAQTETVENEMRDIIRGVTNGQRYAVSDSEYNEIVEAIGSRSEMNRTFRRVYGFTLYPQSEAASKNVQTPFDEGMQELTDALPGIFSRTDETGYDMDNGSVANMALTLYEMQDSMFMQEYGAEEMYGAETLYEGAMEQASKFAEDIIRLTPLRTVADEYVQKMDELRTAYRGKLEAKQKQIASLTEKLRRRENRIDKITADRDARLQAQREYYRDMRHRDTERRQDTANRARLRKKLVRDVKWLRERLENPTDQKHIPEEMKKVVAPFVEAFLENEAQLTGGYAVFTRDSIDRLLTFYQRLNDQNDANEDYSAELAFMYGLYDADIAEKLTKLKETLDGRRLSEMTAQELQDMDDVIANFRHLIRDANSAYVDGQRIVFSESGQRFMRETREKKKDRGSLARKIKSGADGINVNMAKPIYLFKEVVGGEINRYFDAVRQAQNIWAFRIRDSAAAIAMLKDQYHYKDWSGKKNNETFTLDDGTTVVLTKDAALQIYATYKREMSMVTPSHHLTEGGIVLSEDLTDLQHKSAKKVAKSDVDAKMIDSKAHPLTADDLRRIFDTLTDEQRRYADGVVHYMSTVVAEWGNEASMELHGYKKFGQGYYFPFQSSDLYLRQSIGVGDDARIKNKGFTKALTPGANNPVVITGFSEVAAKHIGDMASYSTLAVPLENLNRLLNFKLDRSNSVKADLNETYGKAVNSYIREFLTQMNGGVKADRTEGFANKMMGRFKRSAVALNFSVMVQQPSAVARAMAMIDPQYFVRSTANWFDYKELKKYSGVAIVKELGGWDTGTGRSTTDYLLGESRAADKISEWTGKGAEWMDAITWSHIWNAVKRETAHEMGLKYSRHGMSEEFYRRAAERFNEVADYTQVYDSTLSRSQLMRSQGTFMKMATAFMAEPTTSYNMLVFSGMKRNGKSINKARAIGAFACNVILNTALQSLIGAWRDKDEKSYWERWFKHLIEGVFGTRDNLFVDSEFNVANMIPFIKDIISAFEGYDVGRSDMTLFAEIIKPLRKLIDKFNSRDDDEAIFDYLRDNADLLWQLGVALVNLTPLPTKSLYKDVWLGVGNAIEHAKDGDYSTTVQHIADIWRQNFEGQWDKNQTLYNAVINHDQAALDRYLKVTDEDVQKYVNEANDEFAAKAHAESQKEKQYHNKVQDALKAIDSRVLDAAQALLEYDLDTAERLQQAIMDDGFERDDVVQAIIEMRDDLMPPEEYDDKDAKTPYFASIKLLKQAYEDGNLAGATRVRDALHGQGKTDKDIDSEIQTPINSDFTTGEITLEEARQAYRDYTTYTDSEIDKKLTDKVAERYANGGMSYDEAKQLYSALGVKEDKIGDKLGKLVVKDYEAGEISKDAAVTKYMEQTGETDRSAATMQFDYIDLKEQDETFPLEYGQYEKYVTSGLQSAGADVSTFSTYLNGIKEYTSDYTSAGWEAYAARNRYVKKTKKYTPIQYHCVMDIDRMFDTPAQKDAAYKATAAQKNWNLSKLPYAPWH